MSMQEKRGIPMLKKSVGIFSHLPVEPDKEIRQSSEKRKERKIDNMRKRVIDTIIDKETRDSIS